MRIKREYLYIALCIVFIFLGFGGGYLSGKAIYSDKEAKQNSSENTGTAIQSFQPEPTEFAREASASDVASPIYYLLINEKNFLNLYEINGESRVLIKKINFNMQFLPAEDSQRLTAGIRLDSKEEGYSLIEDFTS